MSELTDAWDSCTDPVAMMKLVVQIHVRQDPVVRAAFECARIAALEIPEELYAIRGAIHTARMWLDKQIDSKEARKRKVPLVGLAPKDRLAAQAANAVLNATYSVGSAPRAVSLAMQSLMTDPKAWSARRARSRFCAVIREHVKLRAKRTGRSKSRR
jgi:hypothetical protein